MFQNPYEMQQNIQTSLMGKRLKGKVIAHHPDKNGLIKIRLADIHDDWPEDCIPWQQADDGFGHGNNQSGRMKEIPPVGAETYSRFLSDNSYHPVYTSGPSSDEKKLPGITDDDKYPYAYGSIDQGGHKEVINTKEGEEDYTRGHVKGTAINMDKKGNLNQSSPEAINNIAKQVMMQVKEAMNLEGKSGHFKFGDNLILEGKNIEFRFENAKSTKPIELGASNPEAPKAPELPKAGQRPKYEQVGQKAYGETQV